MADTTETHSPTQLSLRPQFAEADVAAEAKRRTIEHRCLAVEESLDALGYLSHHAAWRVATLVARVAGFDVLRRSYASIASDRTVKCAAGTVKNVCVELYDHGLFAVRRPWVVARRGRVGIELQLCRAFVEADTLPAGPVECRVASELVARDIVGWSDLVGWLQSIGVAYPLRCRDVSIDNGFDVADVLERCQAAYAGRTTAKEIAQHLIHGRPLPKPRATPNRASGPDAETIIMRGRRDGLSDDAISKQLESVGCSW